MNNFVVLVCARSWTLRGPDLAVWHLCVAGAAGAKIPKTATQELIWSLNAPQAQKYGHFRCERDFAVREGCKTSRERLLRAFPLSDTHLGLISLTRNLQDFDREQLLQ